MSTKITLELPAGAAEKLVEGFRTGDPKLKKLLKEFKITSIAPAKEKKPKFDFVCLDEDCEGSKGLKGIDVGSDAGGESCGLCMGLVEPL